MSEQHQGEPVFVISDSIQLRASAPDINRRALKILKEVESFYGDGKRDATEYLQLRYDLENAASPNEEPSAKEVE